MFTFLASLIMTITLLMLFIFGQFDGFYAEEGPLPLDVEAESNEYFVESGFEKSLNSTADVNPESPRVAYLISGTKSDSHRMMRTLQAVYHPRNQYVLHLDLEAPPRERMELAMSQSNLVLIKTLQ